MPEIMQRIIPSDRKNRPGIKREPRYIIVHDTANPNKGADALMHARYLETTGNAVSWHYTVDDQRIVQHLPLDESAYHAGDGARGPGNLYGIGIEICENADGDRAKAEDNAAWLVAQLLRQYGWGLDRVRQHHEFSPWGKDCPRLLRPRWSRWLDRVRHYLDASSGDESVARPVLRRGDRGDAVRNLQEALKRLGHDPGPIDGIFGPQTEAAVKAFQRAMGITVDGIVGPVTWSKLEAALAAQRAQPQPAPKPAAKPGPFKDVPADHRFAAAIAWAKEQGITQGYGDGTFRPGQPVTRAEVVAMLYRALHQQG